MEELTKLGDLLGLEGQNLADFIKEKLAEEKQERRQKEQEERDERARERELRQMELEVKKLELLSKQNQTEEPRVAGKLPKLPAFVDGKDDIDSYLRRYERFAATNKWNKSIWATNLSALLTGKALDVYSRLSDGEASDYDQLKEALLKRYNYTEEGFRMKFREGKPEGGESPEQFIVRLKNNLHRWVELSGISHTYANLSDLCVKEQFINACPRDLKIHIQERAPKDLSELSDIANKFLLAHNRELAPSSASEPKNIQCFKCSEYGHKSNSCPKNDVKAPSSSTRQCFRCNGVGHEAKVCPSRRPTQQKSGFNTTRGRGNESGACVNTVKEHTCEADESSVRVKSFDECEKKMPVMKGLIGESVVSTLRDTGCSCVVVKSDFVQPEQMTGEFGHMVLIDSTVREVPLALITVNTPFFKGEVKALCLPDAIYDLIIGNIPGARQPEDPDPQWSQAGAVTTRAQAKKTDVLQPLRVPGQDVDVITRQQLQILQREDKSLDRFREMHDVKTKGLQKVSFETNNGILYRVYKHPKVSEIRQVVVPQTLKQRVMQLAHDSLFSGHLGIKKTKDRILTSFYWPGLNRDVANFCKTCDICQKTVHKGSVHKVPLSKMPAIDVPFKRVAVDIVGPIDPPSEGGHRYILTLVDYATRYPEAVPLKKITAESVAEALVSMFSRYGIPDEVLSDRGTQFMSECMREVSRLLGIHQLATTPYHPMCNGLVEKFNGTLKTMLRRMTSEQPRQWHRFIDALLFAYRSVPQESTGFAPFDLLYGRSVRTPVDVLKELWTNDTCDRNNDIKSTYEYVFELRNKLGETLQIAQEELQKSQKRYKHYYDRKAKPRSFKPGDDVLVLLPSHNNKLLMQWRGPYRVDSVVGTNDYKVCMKGKLKTFHANLLKQYSQREMVTPDNAALSMIYGESQTAATSVTHHEILTDEDDDDDLLDLRDCKSKESFEDVRIGEDIPASVEQQLREMVNKYSMVFTDLPGTCNYVVHRINLISEVPVWSKPYPIPYSMRESLRKDIDEMLQLGVIRESDSPYASPVVIVRKKDGTNRICIDYRKLNKITIFDPVPMVTVDDLLSKLSQDRCFSKIDLSKGYYQIPVAEQDIHKTAFVTPDATYEFLKMPFGMVNAAATLMRAMRVILAGMNNVDNYIDDILVHTITWDDHVNVLDELFQRLAKANLTARPTKSLLGSTTIEFLGQDIAAGEVSSHSENTNKVLNAPRPTTKKQLRSFLGLTGYYRNYIPNYAAIAVPLTDLTRKHQPNRVNWEEPQEKAYRTLKRFIASKPILKLPDLEKPFILRTDASDLGVGAVLMQEYDGHLFPVSYASKKLSDRERSYATVEKECLAVVWAIRKFMVYLYGKEFILQTDHQSLAYLNKAKLKNSRVMRWAMFLQSYKFQIQVIKGTDNAGADYLSRI